MKIIGSRTAEAFFASKLCTFATDVVRPWVRSAKRAWGFSVAGELAGGLGGALAGAVGAAVPQPPASSTGVSTRARSFRFTVC
jgi:hypothetical protein